MINLFSISRRIAGCAILFDKNRLPNAEVHSFELQNHNVVVADLVGLVIWHDEFPSLHRGHIILCYCEEYIGDRGLGADGRPTIIEVFKDFNLDLLQFVLRAIGFEYGVIGVDGPFPKLILLPPVDCDGTVPITNND